MNDQASPQDSAPLPDGLKPDPGHDDRGHDHDGHGHGHGHDHLHLGTGEIVRDEELDPANRSLNEALRISFAVLRLVMVVLVIALAISGVREISSNQVGLRLHFGALTGKWAENPATGEREFVPTVLKQGWHLAWPEPIDRIITVPTTDQALAIDKAFWFQVNEADATKSMEELGAGTGPLNNKNDGFLLTADQNIVHAKLRVYWNIDPNRVADFVQSIGIGLPGELDAEGRPLPNTPETALYWAQRTVRAAAERAMVHVTAATDVDTFVTTGVNLDEVRNQTQAQLDKLDAGLLVQSILLADAQPPRQAYEAFQEVSRAQSQGDTAREQARRERSKILNEAAGKGHPALVAAIEYYETLLDLNDDRAELARSVINNLLAGQTAREAVAPIEGFNDLPPVFDDLVGGRQSDLASSLISGQAAAAIAEAETYRTEVVAQVQAEVNDFQQRYDRFAGNAALRRITVMRLWEDVRQRVLTGDVETFYLPKSGDKRLYIEAGRDPRVERERERERFERRKEEAGTR